MSEKEGALDSARTVQLAMLVAVGATLILSGPSEARQRLQDALGEVSSLPHDTVAIRRALTSHCEEGLLDLPDHPTLGWLFDHRKEQKGNGEWIYVSCVTIESSCSILDNVAPALRVQDEALYAKSCDSVRTLALPIEPKLPTPQWSPLSLAEAGALDGALDWTHKTFQEWRAAIDSLNDRCTKLDSRRSNYDNERSRRGAYAVSTPFENAASAQKSESALLTRAAEGFKSALATLRQASSELRNLPLRSSGSHVVLKSNDLDVYLATTIPVAKEQCGPVAPRVGNSGTGHDKLSDCALAKRLYWGLCAEAGTNTQPCFISEDEVCKNAREPSWNFSRLTRAGVWADVRDLDVASAESHLYDAMTKAELETEVLGLKLGRVDALSWLWLAILSAEVYAVCLILLAKPTPEEKEDWWSRLPCQLFVGAATIVGIGVSVASHPDASAAQKEIGKPTVFGYSVTLSIGLFLAIAVLTITAATRLRRNRASGHHRRQS